MTAHIAAWGRLAADPERREGRTGKPWATARLAVGMPVPHGADDDAEPPTLWLGVTVFGERLADSLARHAKGECLSVAGRLEMRPYTARDGSQREGWTVIADSVIGPRTPRPKGDGRPKPETRPAPAGSGGPTAPAPGLSDEIPFK